MPETSLEELRDKHLGKSLVEQLTAPTPPDWIKTRPVRGGGRVPYVPGPRFIQKLNECFGFLWSHEIKSIIRDGDQVISHSRVTVHVPGQTITRDYPNGLKETVRIDPVNIVKEQMGGTEIKKFSQDMKDKQGVIKYKKGDIIDLGDDYKGASTDSFKKACTQLGLFLDVYSSGSDNEGNGEGVTKQQLEAIKMRGEKLGWDEEKTLKWVEEQLEKPKEEWLPLEVMSLISELIALKKEQDGKKV